MKVYRFMNEMELRMYFSGQTQEVGRVMKLDRCGNNHNYKKNTKYVHFFKRLKDVYYIKQHCDFNNRYNKDMRYYIACFDIPKNILNAGQGHYYREHFSGYEHPGTVKVAEYAVESSLMKEEYLIYFKQEKADYNLHWTKDKMDKEK